MLRSLILYTLCDGFLVVPMVGSKLKKYIDERIKSNLTRSVSSGLHYCAGECDHRRPVLRASQHYFNHRLWSDAAANRHLEYSSCVVPRGAAKDGMLRGINLCWTMRALAGYLDPTVKISVETPMPGKHLHKMIRQLIMPPRKPNIEVVY